MQKINFVLNYVLNYDIIILKGGTLVNKLKEIREKKGIKKNFIAKKLKISRDRLDRIEDGKADLPARLIPVLSEIYGVSEIVIINSCVEAYNGI